MIQEYIIISEGTLRDEDLFEAFVSHLDEAAPSSAEYFRLEWASASEDERSFILNEELFDAMDKVAPTGTYFGASEGDGACFGYWPIPVDEPDAMREM